MFLTLGVIGRLIEHPANFTPVGALIIFYGAKKGFFSGALLGLSIMIISDTLLGFSYASIFVYAGFISYALAAKFYNKRYGLISAPLLSSTLFFFITNFGVWLGPWYEHSFTGLIKCFTLAVPFYRNMILGDVIFMFLIYFGYQIAIKIDYKLYINKLEGACRLLLTRVSLKKK